MPAQDRSRHSLAHRHDLLYASRVSASMFTDQPAVNFENPARDPLGREHIGGRVVAGEEHLLIFWEYRHNVFRDEGPRTVKIPYESVDAVEFQRTLLFWNPRLVITLTNPEPLASIPGVETGKATLHLSGSNLRDACRRIISLTEFRRSEAQQQQRSQRLDALTRDSSP
jgi:hypothetical protein